MKRWQLLAALITVILASGQGDAYAGTVQASVTVAISGEGQPTAQETFYPPNDPNALCDGPGCGAYIIDGYVMQNAEARIDLSGFLDPDPTILFSGAVVDFGSPSNFSFSFVLPLVPTVSNPSIVFDSLSGSATDSANNGVTLTPNPPPAGIPTDSDGVPEIQVFTVSTNGTIWQNVGLDQGPAEVFPNGATSDTYGPFAEGPIPTIAGGPWNWMRADLNFRLSGQGDAFSFTGRKDLLPVPEPGSVILSGLALVAYFFCRRRTSL